MKGTPNNPLQRWLGEKATGGLMEKPNVNKGDRIKIKSSEHGQRIDGYVFAVFENGSLSVGYCQNHGAD